MKNLKKAKDKKSASRALKTKAKKVMKKVLAQVKAATAKPKKPAKQMQGTRRASPRKRKVEQAVNRVSEEEPTKLLVLSPTNLPVTINYRNLNDEVTVDEPEQPPYEEPEVANDWRGPFVEAAPVGWQSKRFTPGFKVA